MSDRVLPHPLHCKLIQDDCCELNVVYNLWLRTVTQNLIILGFIEIDKTHFIVIS
jgi:hypothetical protein